MTPEEFYNGPAKKLATLATAKRSLLTDPENTVEWHRRVAPIWERVCRYCRRPSAKSVNIYEDLADVVAYVILLGDGINVDALQKADEVMKPKMVDYAGDEDFSANFRRNAKRAGLTPAKVWVVFASKHWDAVCAYALRGRTESEPIEYRIADVVNYCLLLAGMVAEGTA